MATDGLRIVFYARALDQAFYVMYSDRPTIDDRFRPADQITGVPNVADPFLTEDCARIYFSGLGSVFYESQL